MYDRYDRGISYLRISVTDRCNLNCSYCMPEKGLGLLQQEELLKLEEICDVARTAVADFGFEKVKLTGGEPLLRSDIVDITRSLCSISGLKDCSMTTNGILLEKYAVGLKEAGMTRINISLDTLDPERYREITRGGDISAVLRGIDAAVSAGMKPVKLNCVVEDSSDEIDARMVGEYAGARGLMARYIKRMDLANGVFGVIQGGSGGNCAECNRLRLSSDGWIYPCLFDDTRFSLRELGAHEALRNAISAKPSGGGRSLKNCFSRIGG